jgi:hypothetical protein
VVTYGNFTNLNFENDKNETRHTGKLTHQGLGFARGYDVAVGTLAHHKCGSLVQKVASQ